MEELVKHLEKKKSRTLQYMLNAFIAYMAVLVLAVLIFVMSFTLVHVCGDSMLPTLTHHSFGLLVRTERVDLGDIVVIRTADSRDRSIPRLIKRIVATEGDVVVFKRGTTEDESDFVFLYVNNVRAYEPFVSEPISYYISDTDRRPRPLGNGQHFRINVPRTVPEGEIMFLGDNRNNTADSRNYGFLPLSRLDGRIVNMLVPDSFTEKLVLFLFREDGNCAALNCSRKGRG